MSSKLRYVAAALVVGLSCPIPLHLGVTHAGPPETGRIRSIATLGALLANGIADVTTLQDSSQVMRALATGMHNVLLLDWVMPDPSGADLLPEVVRHRRIGCFADLHRTIRLAIEHEVEASELGLLLGMVVADDVDVLEHRVGGPGVPLVLGDALARGQDVEALVADGLQEVPPALQMPDQAVRLVLRRNGQIGRAHV